LDGLHCDHARDGTLRLRFMSATRYFAPQTEGVTLGPWYIDEAKAQTAVDSLNREWEGKRTFQVNTFISDSYYRIHYIDQP